MTRTGTFAAPAGFHDSPHRALAPGEVVASTYAIRDEIARTDTGVVFEARDMLLDRLVAVKVAWRDPGTPSLLGEARRCAIVRQACAVQIHGIGSHNGVEFVVGERVSGHLLRAELEQRLAPDAYLRTLRTVFSAVAHSHEAGVAVGEISGSTVLVASTSEPVRMVLGRLSLSQVPAFGPQGRVLAPEIVRGDTDTADPTAAEAIDIYGLGYVALELAAGTPPFADKVLAVELQRHVSEPPPRIVDLRPDLPTELSDLVDWLMVKQPAGRPRSVADVLAQLDAIIERIGTGIRPVRVLVVDDDATRARWLWSVVRRAHASVIVEIATEGNDAAHKLNRDQPDLVFIDADLRGVMNALELCMYARGLEGVHGEFCLIGEVSERDRPLLESANVELLADDAHLPSAVLDRVRAAVYESPNAARTRTRVSG